jgi:hypothetical protein
MAKSKFVLPFEDVQEIFSDLIAKTGLENQDINITIVVNNKSKKIFDVVKANDLLKFRSGDDVLIILNEQIFEKLTVEQQKIVAEQALAYISYDGEKDKIVITKPDFIEHTGIIAKYGFETINVLKESIISLYQAQEQDEEENKQTTDV